METEDHGYAIPRRWDPQWIARRRSMEAVRLGYCGYGPPGQPKPPSWPYRFLGTGLKMLGLYGRGYRNFQNVRTTRIHHSLPGWPMVLNGYRILQVSDLHIDLDASLMEPLCRELKQAHADLVVFTGDFWEGSNTDFATALERMKHILRTIPTPRHGHYGVLGNHDPAALGGALETLGLTILVNEAVTLESGPVAFALAGVDDPYYFKQDDVAAASRGCPDSMAKILLSHSPEVAPQAETEGFSLVLSGHTHGGQVCLPGGHSLVRMEQIPAPLFRGEWRYGSMRGYTTTGAGACHVPVRFNSPAEIVLHTLSGCGLSDGSGSGGCSGE